MKKAKVKIKKVGDKWYGFWFRAEMETKFTFSSSNKFLPTLE